MRLLQTTVEELAGLGERLSARAASVVRLGTGSRVRSVGPRPDERLVLYQMENCPYSRKVREALSVLDLNADIRPCPKQGRRFRMELLKRGGKEKIPFLFDPNTGAALYDSETIVYYLFRQYGSGRPPLALRLRRLATWSSRLVTLLHGGSGPVAEASRRAGGPLELWSFESHPDCQRVRLRLDALELAYTLHNVAAGSSERRQMWRETHTDDVPQLADAAFGLRITGAPAILEHLDRQYARFPSSAAAALEEALAPR